MNFATLPDRTVAMFARMGDPDAIAELRMRVKKYNPDQPRDFHGRFSFADDAGGGSDAVSSPSIESRISDSGIPAGWNSDIAKYISEHPELKMFDNLRKNSFEQKTFLRNEFAKHLDGLSRQEKNAIETYLERGNTMNSILRMQENPANNVDAFGKSLVADARIFSETVNNSVKLTEDVVLERGMASIEGPINNPQVGEIVTGEGGVISTTIQPSIAEQFASGMYFNSNYAQYHGEEWTRSTIWHIYAPAGTTALGINLDGTKQQVAEGEVVLPRDTKFEIVGRTETKPTDFMLFSQMTANDTMPVSKVTHIWAKVVS